jgi:hypothetical protein
MAWVWLAKDCWMALTSAALLAIPANLCFLEQKFTCKKTSRYIYHYKSTLVDVPFKNVLYDVCTVQYGDPIACFQSAPLLSGQESYTVKKVIDFPVPSRDATNQTLAGRE